LYNFFKCIANNTLSKKECKKEHAVAAKRQSASTVRDMMVGKSETSARVRGLLHNAAMLGEPQIKEEGNFIIAIIWKIQIL